MIHLMYIRCKKKPLFKIPSNRPRKLALCSNTDGVVTNPYHRLTVLNHDARVKDVQLLSFVKIDGRNITFHILERNIRAYFLYPTGVLTHGTLVVLERRIISQHLCACHLLRDNTISWPQSGVVVNRGSSDLSLFSHG
jgi:hypothetical protein